MSRTSTANYTVDTPPEQVSGYDYSRGAWVLNGFYTSCGHPAQMDCGCWGRDHASDPVPPSSFPDIH